MITIRNQNLGPNNPKKLQTKPFRIHIIIGAQTKPKEEARNTGIICTAYSPFAQVGFEQRRVQLNGLVRIRNSLWTKNKKQNV